MLSYRSKCVNGMKAKDAFDMTAPTRQTAVQTNTFVRCCQEWNLSESGRDTSLDDTMSSLAVDVLITSFLGHQFSSPMSYTHHA